MGTTKQYRVIDANGDPITYEPYQSLAELIAIYSVYPGDRIQARTVTTSDWRDYNE